MEPVNIGGLSNELYKPKVFETLNETEANKVLISTIDQIIEHIKLVLNPTGDSPPPQLLKSSFDTIEDKSQGVREEFHLFKKNGTRIIITSSGDVLTISKYDKNNTLRRQLEVHNYPLHTCIHEGRIDKSLYHYREDFNDKVKTFFAEIISSKYLISSNI